MWQRDANLVPQENFSSARQLPVRTALNAQGPTLRLHSYYIHRRKKVKRNCGKIIRPLFHLIISLYFMHLFANNFVDLVDIHRF